jgi:hypothetical protein
MRLASFLSRADAQRAGTTLRKLQDHKIASLVLTGGFAIEMHRMRIGLEPMIRPLHDIDFLARLFNEIPATLAMDFFFRHVHPDVPPARTLMQAVDPETAVRVDVFRAYGKEMDRAVVLEGTDGGMRIISLEDLVARTARLCLDLASDTPIPGKRARDFLRLLPTIESAAIEAVWKEHRKPFHPESFREAASLLSRLIPARAGLQIVPVYSRDFESKCLRCEAISAFPLADGRRIFSLLGYC